MSATEPTCPHAVPWRAARLLPGIDNVAHAIFGIQAPTADGTAAHSAELIRLFDGESGPQTVERASYVDPQRFHCEVFMAYWLDDARYRAWAESRAVSTWWQGLPVAANASAGPGAGGATAMAPAAFGPLFSPAGAESASQTSSDPRVAEVYALSDQGLSIRDVARRVGIPHGEIELMLNVRARPEKRPAAAS